MVVSRAQHAESVTSSTGRVADTEVCRDYSGLLPRKLQDSATVSKHALASLVLFSASEGQWLCRVSRQVLASVCNVSTAGDLDGRGAGGRNEVLRCAGF